MFSVLMSLYDKESPENLEGCLKSLNEQYLKADEVVLVFDGHISKELRDVVNNYINCLNIRIIAIDENVGLGRALNIGLNHCEFNVVARMDTDDVCNKDRFKKQIEIMEGSDIDLLGSAIIEFDEYGNERLKKLPTHQDEIRRFLKIKNPFNHMSVIFKKDRVIDVGGYKHHLFMEDYNLWIRMVMSGCKVYNMDEVLLYARVGSEMIKKRRGLKYLNSEWQLFKIKIEYKVTSKLEGVKFLLLRSIARVIPATLLSYLYDKDRG